MGKAPQLHEVLAVEGDLAGQSQRIIEETIKTFGRSELFTGSTKTLKMDDDNRSSEEAAGFEQREITTTVKARLDYTAESATRYIDASFQKERTNQDAKSDIVIGDVTVASDVPATALLGLEKRLKEIRKVYESVPTLQQGVKWEKSPDDGADIWKAENAEVRTRTEKTVTPVVLYEATKEHPAQVKEVAKDVVVGKFTEEKISGMVTSAQKSAWIGRIDELIRAVKQARKRANNTDVVLVEIGQKLFNYINMEDF